MQLWALMDQVKVHYLIFYLGKKGYEVNGTVSFEGENLLELENRGESS